MTHSSAAWRSTLLTFAVFTALAACSVGTPVHPPADASDAWFTPLDARPGTGEICGNGIDDNDNDLADENCPCLPDTSQSCFDSDPTRQHTAPCHPGTMHCIGSGEFGMWSPCEGEVIPSPEECGDHIDNDCNGEVDCNDSACELAVVCDNPACTPGSVQIDAATSQGELMIVADRSVSMGIPISSGTTEWAALKQAMRTVLPEVDRSLSMGLILFPRPMGNDFAGLCAVGASVDVGIMRPSATMIVNAFEARGPAGFTPTIQALDLAERYFQAHPSPRRRFILLATDGFPSCSHVLGDVIAKLQSLRSDSHVDTMVLGITENEPLFIQALNQLADAGGRPLSGTRHFYGGASPTQLVDGLRTSTRTAACSFSLGMSVTAPIANVVVRTDSTAVPHDGTNGWTFTSDTNDEVLLHGTACDRVRSGTARTVHVDWTCP